MSTTPTPRPPYTYRVIVCGRMNETATYYLQASTAADARVQGRRRASEEKAAGTNFPYSARPTVAVVERVNPEPGHQQWLPLADACERIARELIAAGMPEAQAVEQAADTVIAGLPR